MAEKGMTATWSDHLHQNPGSLLGVPGSAHLLQAAQVVGKWIRASDTWEGLQFCQAGHAKQAGSKVLWGQQAGALALEQAKEANSSWGRGSEFMLDSWEEDGPTALQEGQGGQGNLLVERRREKLLNHEE